MTIIFIEAVLFLAFLAVVGAFVLAAFRSTDLGMQLRQRANRRRLDRAADLTCPVHGPQREEELVRLATGEPLCPHCYQDAIHGHLP
ncbi:MAG: hypothetical protein KJT01_09735 [Gemmatimonadetes bacterium]|nr:hypothetical protein [Gemmatimonadota bacterium]